MKEIKLMKWLKRNCLTKICKLNNEYDYYWCLMKDADILWDGIDDDHLRWYTDEEMFEIYKKSNQKNL
jgi:hypothetical protein